MTERNTPVVCCKAGAVQASVWRNFIDVKGRKTEILKVSVQKRYKDLEGWKTTTSFNRTEAFLAVHTLQQAIAKMIELQNEQLNSNNGEESA